MQIAGKFTRRKSADISLYLRLDELFQNLKKRLHGIFLNSRSCALCSVKLNISRFLIVTKISPIKYILSQIVIIKVINKIQRGRKCTGALSPAKMTFEIAVLYKDDKFYIISKFFHVQIKQYHRQFTKHNIFF